MCGVGCYKSYQIRILGKHRNIPWIKLKQLHSKSQYFLIHSALDQQEFHILPSTQNAICGLDFRKERETTEWNQSRSQNRLCRRNPLIYGGSLDVTERLFIEVVFGQVVEQVHCVQEERTGAKGERWGRGCLSSRFFNFVAAWSVTCLKGFRYNGRYVKNNVAQGLGNNVPAKFRQ